ncbi:1-acyl-sn-glycerol-3-phosphate acyltransferase [Membranihabitans marinus]|uniref:1-acyl-sn-glycerol-3-phosphate acyltransferase n=1 Tax=Membranihabitans marinus TaxID=1227546 RepID=UPI001F007112|nr:1-acyl-sn-glycerol-3-phosphate acyltransferase [Membranihabitans marinus]
MSISQKIAKFILSLWGWKITGNIPNTAKGVFIVAPHTHWQDIPLGLLVRTAIDLKVCFVAKKSLFKGLSGRIFYALGGYPVDRSKNRGFVDAVVDIFNSKESFFIAIAPEGTRKKVSEFRSGFYYIAHKAKIPMYLTKFDFENKCVDFSPPFWTTDNAEETIATVENYFRGVKGKIVNRSF